MDLRRTIAFGRRLATIVRDDHVFLILMAAVVGVSSGAAAGALLGWIEFANRLFPKPDEGTQWARWAIVVLVPALGGLVAGGLLVFTRRFVRQPLVIGLRSVIEAVATRDGVIRGRQAAIVGAGTGITIGSGGSCGYEAPSVALGAAVGSVLGRTFRLPRGRQLAMVGAGCAGGLAAAFNAPLAGVIFTVEIIFRGAIGGDVGSMSMLVPLIVAAVAGTFTSHAIRGEHPAFELTEHVQASIPELGFYVLLAIAAGLLGTTLERSVAIVSKRFESLRAPLWLKPAIGGVGVGLMAALVSNELLGAGHATVARALAGSLAWQLALALCVLKIVATALTLGSGGFGGVFMPALYVGATMGAGFGALELAALGPGGQGAGAFAVVGMGAIFAATMHAPITPIVMIFELTRDYGIILPLMLGCILAAFVGKRLHLRHAPDAGHSRDGAHSEGGVMQSHAVRELMRPPEGVLTEAASLDEIRQAIFGGGARSAFVVDAEGAVVGFVDGNQIARRMLVDEIQPGSTARELMGTRRLALLYGSDTLAGAMLASARSGMSLMPVVDDARRLIGVLHGDDLLAYYSSRVLDASEEEISPAGTHAVADQELVLGKGLVLERIVVGRAWAGRSLAQLEIRSRTGCTILEWSRGEMIVPIDPRVPLREADILAIAGSRQQIAAARRLR